MLKVNDKEIIVETVEDKKPVLPSSFRESNYEAFLKLLDERVKGLNLVTNFVKRIPST